MSPEELAAAGIVVEQARINVRLIRLARPERLNAFTRDMVDAFHAAIDLVEADTACRVVVLAGTGRGFCAGQDMAAAAARNSETGARVVERMHWQSRFAGMGGRMRASRLPFIAAVNGAAAGAGMAVALSADLRIATPSLKLLVAAVRIGLSAGESGISYLLPRLIGAGRAFDILLTGRPILAEEALRIGLVSAVVQETALTEAALSKADEIAANAPWSIAETKRLMWENLDASYAGAISLENRTQILATHTDDYREATQAYVDKRPPRFRGR